MTEAVSELQSELDNGAIVNPPMPNPISTKTIRQDENNRLISQVDFDIAVTTENASGFDGTAKAGLLQVLSVKMCGNSEQKNESASRISFSIPVILPTASMLTDDQRRERANLDYLCRLDEERKTLYDDKTPE